MVVMPPKAVLPKAANDADTRVRLLIAAERLLLASGYEQVSVRAICTEAGANPAAVHYHFGSKDALVTALLEDRLGPTWAQPLAELSNNAASVSSYVDAIIAPFADLAADPIGRLHLHLLARLVLGRHDLDWNSRWFRMDSWVQVLRGEHPGLTEKEAIRRWTLAFELILHQFGDPLVGDRTLSAGSIAALRSFVQAGLNAPVQVVR